MNKTLGGIYQKDERVTYNFSFYNDDDGKHVEVRFRAEPNWDLDTIFNEFRNFLIATGHDIEGQIGELNFDERSYEDEDEPAALARWSEDYDAYREAAVQNFQNQTQDKFSMDHLPNNGWPFGGLTTTSLPGLTSVDLSSLSSQSYAGWSEQVQVWSLPSMEIKALTSADIATWSVPAPGTLGGAKVTF